MTDPASTRITRLKAAGWVHVSGWLPAGRVAYDIAERIDGWRDEAERIASTPAKRGRPPRAARKAALKELARLGQEYDAAVARGEE